MARLTMERVVERVAQVLATRAVLEAADPPLQSGPTQLARQPLGRSTRAGGDRHRVTTARMASPDKVGEAAAAHLELEWAAAEEALAGAAAERAAKAAKAAARASRSLHSIP